MKKQKLQSLQSLKVPELQKKAKALGAKDISGMKKQELIKLIYELQAKNKEKIYATGVLEILPDGYGFLNLKIAVICLGLMIYTYLILK